MLLPKIAMLDMASQCKQYEANPNCLFSKITSGNAIQKPPTKPGPKGQEVPLDGKDRVPPEKGKFYSDTQTEAADAIRMMSHPLVNLPIKLSDPQEMKKFEHSFVKKIRQNINELNVKLIERYIISVINLLFL